MPVPTPSGRSRVRVLPRHRDRLSIPLLEPWLAKALFVYGYFMAHFVYIIQSELDGTFYIGESKDPTDRLEKHNRPHKAVQAYKFQLQADREGSRRRWNGYQPPIPKYQPDDCNRTGICVYLSP
ncbi:GIY-YIG nuclease family protein [Lunatimonas salinarum]|uniref:GIY-YIG nuclease family protein n=1 Tax=Lunatimonas salinarum TaxID=1774590 RepID=UPI001FD76423|nr:GIY-YIG nuclease family protein [Lunatimonas salinarum]